ncbi:GTPase [Sulfuriferula sp. AH1]|uniref:dynamin family protein n=1 Tax=Sulfuriferula sp. AH1 TaxID=1985873 RepID=UPI000B3B3AA7|nr:dynamin family protein [Sulfuriferula sp. AH1]ARU32644.1 GTPase [Sulfuriferula sp. AH1]
MSNLTLAQQFEQYGAWREGLATQIGHYRDWLNHEEINDWQIDLRLQHLIDRLAEDKLNVAFVAEFSRGKSELINAIFFADYKKRLLPSTAGRTTMCPTELLYDASRPPSIQLLPIATRAGNVTTTEYKRYPDEWTTIPLDVDSADAMLETLQRVSETQQVSKEEAEKYGLYRAQDADSLLTVSADGTVEIPRWRHAIINFPHPLLQKGLVILDTPGLNAIGTEPELTLNLLPSAHAIIFILAADTGVTKSDIEVWRNHIAPIQGGHRGRLIVLNKIDGLWDDLKSQEAIDAEIQSQVESCANLLGLQNKQIYPVSAQKGLLAKISNDAALLAKSRLEELEHALSDELIPSKQDIVRDNTASEMGDLVTSTRELLGARLKNVDEQLEELTGLRGKNEEVVQHMMTKVEEEKAHFEKGLQQFQALRSVFSHHSNELFSHLGMDRIKTEVRDTRIAMENSRFSSGLRSAMSSFFAKVDQNITHSATQIDEIKEMMAAMYKKFSTEHGLTEVTPPTYSTFKYKKEMDRLEKSYNEHFNTLLNMLTNEQHTLTAKFFETLASRVVNIYEVANREADSWLKAVMAPMETQVREHQMQLRRRLESIKRIHKATDTLEDRIAELQEMRININNQLNALDKLDRDIKYALVAALNQENAIAA